MADNMDLGQDLGWEGEVSDEGGFTLLDEGYYPFTVKKLERERFEGSAKIAACSRAKLTLEVVAGNQTITITDRLLLNTKTQWRIAAFFASLGFVKNAETGKMPMAWNQIEEKQGWIKLGIREYTTKNGEKRQSNEVSEYVSPANAEKAYVEWNSRYGQGMRQAPQAAAQPAPQQTAMPVPAQPQTAINPSTGQQWSV